MGNLKSWLFQVGAKKMLPSAIRAAIAALVGLMAAHSGMLAQLGIVYDKVTNDVTIHLTQLSAWLGVTGIGLITAFFTAAQHHVESTVKGEPQCGNPALEQRRATDEKGN